MSGLPADGQTEAHAAPVRAPLRERREEVLGLARRQPAAFVLHVELHAVRGGVHAQGDVAVPTRELEGVLQDRVIARLHYALHEPGFLTLGSSETVRAFAGFAPVDGKSKIYGRTSAALRPVFDFAHSSELDARRAPDRVAPSAGGEPTLGPSSRSSSGRTDVLREADRVVLAKLGPPGVVVTSELVVIQFRGQTGPFLEPTPGVASLDLLRMARGELRLPLRRAIDVARFTHKPAREPGVTVLVGGEHRAVTIEILPFIVRSTLEQRFFVVLFHLDTSRSPSEDAPRAPPEPLPVHARALEDELASTREYLESVIERVEASNEELRAANEEIVSSNEELRSTNEELQSAKEELQATNEELGTVNDELKASNVEATLLGDDLENVLKSSEIPLFIVGKDQALRRFTPAAGRLFGLGGTDLGRPVGACGQLTVLAPTLAPLITEALDRLQTGSCAFQAPLSPGSEPPAPDGRWHQLSVRPYLTSGGRIDGAVVLARDVDAETRRSERLDDARKYAEDIVETVREGLVVLDRDRRVRSANSAFQQLFQLSLADIVGKHLDALGRPELAVPALRALVAQLGDGGRFEGFQLEPRGGVGDQRVFRVNARSIFGAELLLLAFDDVTELERARTMRAELGFREAMTGAAEGILMIRPSGHVSFANPAAARLFGYEADGLEGLSIGTLLAPGSLAESPAEILATLREAPPERRLGKERELLARRKDGSDFPIEVSISTTRGEDGPIVVAFITDVTEQRSAEREIRAYQGRLQRLAFDTALTEERERRRIALELHDRIGQDLALAQMKLAPMRDGLTSGGHAAVEGAVELIEKAITDSRTLVFELSPPVLYDLGLGAALAWLAQDVEKRHGVRLEVTDDGADKPLDDAGKAIVFRAVRELVMNVLKHARVPTAKLSLRRTDDHLQIDLRDRGLGFDPDAPTEPGVGFGLLSVREQIARLGGTLQIDAAPEKGTHVSVRVPLRAHGEETP